MIVKLIISDLLNFKFQMIKNVNLYYYHDNITIE